MKKLSLLLITLLCSISAIGQITFTASLNKNKVGKNEQFTLTYTVNEDAGNFSPPNLADFSILSGPNSSSSTTIINGKVSKENSYTYYLRAKKTGIYTISSASILVNGRKVRSNNVTIQVLKSSPKQSNSHSPEAKAKENVFLELEFNNQNPYVGEQIVATYKLYFNQEIRSPEIIENPNFIGFWHEDYELGENYPIKNEVKNGIKYQVATLKKVVLIPQRSGTLNVSAMELDVPVYIPTNQRDFFGRRRSRAINLVCSTGDKNIKVKELPAAGKPASYRGAIGQFKFTTKLDRDSISTNESANLSLRVSGTGNLRMIELPNFDIPRDIESYEPKYKESIQVKKNGLTGYKREESLLIPRNKGSYKIPSLSFSYFDPSKEKYFEETSPSYFLHVDGDVNTKNSSVVINNIEKEDVTFIGKDILYIKTGDSNLAIPEIEFYNSKTYIWLIRVPIFLTILSIIIAFLFKKSIIDPNKWKRNTASKKAISLLKKADVHDANSMIEQALELFFKSKWNIDRRNFNKEFLVELLNSKSIPTKYISELEELLEFCEILRFTQSSNADNLKSAINRTELLIEELENYD